MKPVQWQKSMIHVLLALIPAVVAAVYFFGYRVLAMLAVSAAAAYYMEWLFVRYKGKPVTSAAFVTSTLLALTLPPTFPLWMVSVGAAAGIVFGKMMLGGFGRNPFNPALVGRSFLYISFGYFMTGRFFAPPEGLLKGLIAWSPAPDTLTMATPLGLWREFPGQYQYETMDLFLGNIGGSAGETCAVAILIGAAYLIYKKVASWRIMLAVVLGAAATSLIGRAFGAERIPDLTFTFTSGGLLFGLVFMATDPVSGPNTNPGRWIVGVGVGSLTVILRSYSVFPGGFMFAILLMNMITPIIDLLVKQQKAAMKARKATT